MAEGKPKNAAAGAAVLALGAAAVAGLVWYLQRPPEPPVPAPDVAAAPDAPATAAQQPAAPQAEVAPEAPRFDTVRVTPDGSALVAGRAPVGAEVSLRLDGAEIARATADANGAFVAMFALPPSADPRMLSLVTLGETEVPAAETVAITPTGTPVASVEPAAPAAPLEGSAEPPTDVGAATAEPPATTVPPTALLVTDQGATVVQSATQVADGSVSIAAIAYTPDGAVQLSGRGAGGASVRLYLDNAAVADALVLANGSWVSVLRDVNPGLYTLRADQLDAGGKVTSRFETPFQRETPEALAAVLKPAAAAGVPVARRPATPATDTTQPAIGADGDAAATPTADAGASASTAPASPAAPGAEGAPQVPISVTVQPGFTLWRIAREKFGDGVMYVKVFDANKDQIRDPDLIYPGQVFMIPGQ